MSKIKTWCMGSIAVGIWGLAPACSVETAASEPEVVASSDEALTCSNPNGVNAWLAAIVVASGQEMRRWIPSHDFIWNDSTDRLELSYYGKSRCDDKKCFNTQELLNMQNSAANNQVVFPGGDKLNTKTLHDVLHANFEKQFACDDADGGNFNCPVEYHSLALTGFKKGDCGSVYTFKATATDGKTLLNSPNLLANRLIWAGYTGKSDTNPYLSFQFTSSSVSVDPTIGLNEGDATSSGSCTAACTLVSSTSVSGQCCSCNQVTKTYSRSPWSAGTYLCK
jgi:hypothetical protein